MVLMSLAEVCEVNPSKKEIKLSDSAEISFIPMAAVSESGKILVTETRKISEVKQGFTYFRNGDILVAKITPCFENGKRTIAQNLQNGIGFGSTEFHVLRPKKDILTEFVYYVVSSKHFREFTAPKMKGSAGQKRIPREVFELYRIDVPPIAEQKRIVTLLDRADRLKYLRQQANEETSKFLQAAFLEIFGNPHLNPKKWQIKQIKDVGEIVSGSTPKTNQAECWGGRIKWVTPAELIDGDNYYYSETQRKITEKGLKSIGGRLFPKDTVMLTTRAPIGKVAIAGDTMCSNQGFKNIICDKAIINPAYLYVWLLMNKRYLNDIGTGATFKEINKKTVESISMPVPPISLQNQFAELIKMFESFKKQQNESTMKTNTLFEALLQQAFTA